jgi:hypothetical protein
MVDRGWWMADSEGRGGVSDEDEGLMVSESLAFRRIPKDGDCDLSYF